MPSIKTILPAPAALLLAAMSYVPVAQAEAEPPALVQNLCQNCHGVDGVAVLPGAANLAGQQKEYLRQQLREYRSGHRKSPHMSIIAQSLSDEAIAELSEWYSSIKVTVEMPQ